MARKISGGQVGSPSVGAIQVAPTAVMTTATDRDITISPAGTASLVITNNAILEAQSDLRFADADNSNWVALQAPATIASNVTWSLPATDGSNQQILTTDGSGALSFTDKSLPITNDTSDTGTNYVLFSSTSSGNLTAPRTANTKITFVPNDGALTVDGVVRSRRSSNIRTSSYTLELTDQNLTVEMNSASATTVTVPPNSSVAFPLGSVIFIARIGTGAVTLAAGAGVTLSKSGTFDSYEEISIRKRATDEWVVIDNERLRGSGGDTLSLSPPNQQSHIYTTVQTTSFSIV